jgi:ADP-heptose:LPS heptosyltransferase
MTPPAPDRPVSVVVPIVAGIGNAILAVPMVRAMKRAMAPGSHVTILARTSAMAEPFRRLPEVDDVRVTGAGAGGMLRLITSARRARADYYVVPFPSNRWQYSMLALTSGARRAILHGYPTPRWRSLQFIGTRVPAVRGLHDVEQNLRLLSAMGIENPPVERPVFALNQDDRRHAEEMLLDAGVDRSARFVAVHAGSAGTILARAKRWPPVKYAELIHQLTHDLEMNVVLLEGPDEAGVAAEIVRDYRVRFDCADRPVAGAKLVVLKLTGPLGDAAALLERAALYVGTDSGLAHLAAAVGTRAVTLFAPADPQRVCPFGQRELVVPANVSCSPCFMYPWQTPYPKMRCCEPYCIDTIEVERVVSMVRGALGLDVQTVSSPSVKAAKVGG